MKNQLLFLAISFMLLTTMSYVLGHAGETNTTDTETGDSEAGLLTLEQIYFITILIAILLAFILENRGIVKHRSFVYKLIGFGLLFLTVDFIIYREYFV